MRPNLPSKFVLLFFAIFTGLNVVVFSIPPHHRLWRRSKTSFGGAGDDGFAASASNLFRAMIQNSNNPGDDNTQEMMASLRDRFASIAAFGYSLLSTYTLLAMRLNSNGTSSPVMPTALAQLTEFVPDDIKTFFGPPKSDDKPDEAVIQELECVNGCIKKVERQMMSKLDPLGTFSHRGDQLMGGGGGLNAMAAIGAIGTLNCSDETSGRNCIAGCGTGMYASFLVSQLDWFLGQYCGQSGSDQLDMLGLLGGCQLAQIPQLAFTYTFNAGGNFVSAFQQAQSDTQRCGVVKKMLIDDFADSLASACRPPPIRFANIGGVSTTSPQMLLKRMLQTTAGYSLAQNTRGAIFKRCPNVYTVN